VDDLVRPEQQEGALQAKRRPVPKDWQAFDTPLPCRRSEWMTPSFWTRHP